MVRSSCGLLAWVFCLLLASTGQAPAATFQVPLIHGGVVLPDGVTLVVTSPSAGSLIYFDTVAEKELRRTELDFQPAAIASQGNTLIVAGKGSAILHVLDAATGKELREVRLPGEPVQAVACHPSKGLVYATNLRHEVYAVDPANGKVTKTDAKGQYIVVDPAAGSHVYTGIQQAITDVLLIQEGPGKKIEISLDQANVRAVMLKYAVDGAALKLVGANDNAAQNGRSLAVSRDGKRVSMAGGGGWRSMTDPKFNYVIAVFETADMKTMLGQIDTGAYPSSIAFHPVLNLGASFRSSGGELAIFNANSFVKKEVFKVKQGTEHPLLTFGGRGTKVIYGSVPGIGARITSTTLEFFDLNLTDQDREALAKAYRK